MISGNNALKQLIEENAVGQLRHRAGLMATLGKENGELKLDWIDAVEHLLNDPTQLEEVENEAQDLWQRGIRHLIWAGMGGSILTVRVLAELGFCSGDDGEHIAIYPLDSTDPAALNAIVEQIARAKQMTLTENATQSFLRTLLQDVMMVGVAMGMTSEEPITHLAWFTDLLERAGLSPAEHLLVMTLPDSYLDQFARERQAPSRPLQLDGGTGTGGRMSAPGTRVFLLPVALYLTRTKHASGQLRVVLDKAWHHYNLDLATSRPAEHPFVQLAAACSDASIDGACKLLIEMPAGWNVLISWIEQLMEESLGKGDKGIVIFKESAQYSQQACFHAPGSLYVKVTDCQQQGGFTLYQPYLAHQDPLERLAALAASFLGWQLTMALYGYLHHITFAGQPAVENYKARARALRSLAEPLQAIQHWDATFAGDNLLLFAPPETPLNDADPATIFAQSLHQERERMSYLDLTVNGEIPADLEQLIMAHLYTLGNTQLGVPIKLRRAPADYHSTEQGEMDGPPGLISLRLLIRRHDAPLIGSYTDAFLQAQAISTWQAMIEQKRVCCLLLIYGQVGKTLQQFFARVESLIGANQ